MESFPSPQSPGSQHPHHPLLPHGLPADPTRRLVLVCLRRMAAHGIRDAQAALLLIGAFGINFRRPLVLLRAFMTDLADHSARRIVLAPCCALRMTQDEARLLGALAGASHGGSGTAQLRELAGTPHIAQPHATATALAMAFADLGRPL